jgi:hypothetical protein
VKRESDLKAYIKAVHNVPMAIVFALLDIAAFVTVFVFVVDDVWEGLITGAFILVVHIGNFLIFSTQRSEIARLKEQIAELEVRQPDLDLYLLDDGEAFHRMQLRVGERPHEPDLEELTQREAEELEDAYREAKRQESLSARSSIDQILRAAMGRGLKSRHQYENECREHLAQYREYLVDQYAYEASVARLRRLSFQLDNAGAAPADDIVVLIRFPDQFTPLTKEKELSLLENEFDEPPERPSPFETGIGDLGQLSHLRNVTFPPSFVPPDVGPRPIRGPFVEDKNGARVRYEIDELLHGFQCELRPVKFFVSDAAIGTEWQLQFSIHARQLRRGISGSLLIEVELE